MAESSNTITEYQYTIHTSIFLCRVQRQNTNTYLDLIRSSYQLCSVSLWTNVTIIFHRKTVIHRKRNESTPSFWLPMAIFTGHYRPMVHIFILTAHWGNWHWHTRSKDEREQKKKKKMSYTRLIHTNNILWLFPHDLDPKNCLLLY